MMWRTIAAALASAAVLTESAAAQDFPPGTFSLDGVPVYCGNVIFRLDAGLRDVGMAAPGVIVLNPVVLSQMPTAGKLFWAAHECGHHFVGGNESAADCWAVRTGRNQGWFPPQAFDILIWQLRNNPGDFSHAPGPVRIQQMIGCYQS